MDNSLVPKSLMVIGALLFVLGAIWYWVGPSFNLGKLPGDIAIERENFRFYFPITTSILVSVILSLILCLAKNLFNSN